MLAYIHCEHQLDRNKMKYLLILHIRCSCCLITGWLSNFDITRSHSVRRPFVFFFEYVIVTFVNMKFMTTEQSGS